MTQNSPAPQPARPSRPSPAGPGRPLTLATELTYVKGVGPERARVLEGKGLLTVEDLLYYVPRRYEDRTDPKSIGEVRPGETATVVAIVRHAGSRAFRRGRQTIFEADLYDGPHRLRCRWFNSDYLKRVIFPGQVLAVYGRVEEDLSGRYVRLFMTHPQHEVLGTEEEVQPGGGLPGAALSLEVGRIVPIYESAGSGKLTTRFFRRVIFSALERLGGVPDHLPRAVRDALHLLDRWQALRGVHFPAAGSDLAALENFRGPEQFRLIFEEFFFLETGVALKRMRAQRAPGIAFELTGAVREKLKQVLPFHPTAAQKGVLKEIAADMAAPHPMNRLLQGDVGSGKTIVALQAAVIAIENGCQVAVMAPTEILATQHFLYFRGLLRKSGYHVALLTGSATPGEKHKLRRLAAEGLVHITIGTHALIEEQVAFKALGLVIVDEQHRFGVLQRMRLMQKGRWPDVLVMTATPIPRTLAMSLYGELDVSVIDELPPGRQPIVTRVVSDSRVDEVYAFIRKQVAAGRQAYIVYPVVDEPESAVLKRSRTVDRDWGMDGPGAAGAQADPQSAIRNPQLKSAIEMYERFRSAILPGLRVGLLHGRLPSEEKGRVMAAFKAGEIQVLVATTVVEVGVDVPNATVMVIEHAERFGLAQLHQLRGRVGRGANKSYCILVTSGDLTDDAKARLAVLPRTQDGFVIAETDLALRGPGEFFGTRQSGIPAFRVADLLRDAEILELARRQAMEYLKNPPSREEAAALVRYVRDQWARRYGLSLVG